MSDETTPGSNINVSMGDGNQINHIGHVYHRPEPTPYTIIQNGNEVGSINNIVHQTARLIEIRELFYSNAFDPVAPFYLHGTPHVWLQIDGVPAATGSIVGLTPNPVQKFMGVILNKSPRQL
jgi:hypothetical protein